MFDLTCPASEWLDRVGKNPVVRVTLTDWPAIREHCDPVSFEIVGWGRLDHYRLMDAYRNSLSTKSVLEAQWPSVEFTMPTGPDPLIEERERRRNAPPTEEEKRNVEAMRRTVDALKSRIDKKMADAADEPVTREAKS